MTPSPEGEWFGAIPHGAEAFRGDVFCEKTPPPNPLQKRGGISMSPHTPLKRLKGAGQRPLPFGFPSLGDLGLRPRQLPRVVRSEAERTGLVA